MTVASDDETPAIALRTYTSTYFSHAFAQASSAVVISSFLTIICSRVHILFGDCSCPNIYHSLPLHLPLERTYGSSHLTLTSQVDYACNKQMNKDCNRDEICTYEGIDTVMPSLSSLTVIPSLCKPLRDPIRDHNSSS